MFEQETTTRINGAVWVIGFVALLVAFAFAFDRALEIEMGPGPGARVAEK